MPSILTFTNKLLSPLVLFDICLVCLHDDEDDDDNGEPGLLFLPPSAVISALRRGVLIGGQSADACCLINKQRYN